MAKKIISLVVFVLIVLAVIFYFKAPSKQNTTPPITTELVDQLEKTGALDFSLKDLNGTTFQFSDYKGKVVILNFWASWCDPCVEELPSMLKLLEHFKGEVQIVAISADYTQEELVKFLKVLKVESPHLRIAWDSEKSIMGKYMVESLPESFVFDKDQKLVRKIPGSENWASQDALLFFKDLVEKP